MAVIELKAERLSCAHCVRAVTEAIQARDKTAQVEVALETGTVRADTTLDRAAIASAIEGEGYKVTG